MPKCCWKAYQNFLESWPLKKKRQNLGTAETWYRLTWKQGKCSGWRGGLIKNISTGQIVSNRPADFVSWRRVFFVCVCCGTKYRVCICLDIAPQKMFVQFFSVVKTEGRALLKLLGNVQKTRFPLRKQLRCWLGFTGFICICGGCVVSKLHHHCSCLPCFSPSWGTMLKTHIKTWEKKILVGKFVLWLGLDTSVKKKKFFPSDGEPLLKSRSLL